MDINKLAKRRMLVLTEADYSLPDNLEEEDSTEEDPDVTDEENITEDDIADISKPLPSENEEDFEVPATDPADEPEEDTSTDDEEITDETDTEEDFIPDNEAQPSIPTMKVLNNLSPAQYKLNNLRCMKDLRKLAETVNSTININIINIVAKNAQQRQAIQIVRDNLTKMIEDINNYIIYNYSDSYESNIVTYLTFLKRYRTAMSVIEKIVEANKVEAEKEAK